MKPTIHGPIVHSDRSRQHSRLHRPLRYSFRAGLQRVREDHGKDLSFIIICACLTAACVVAALGCRGLLL